MDTSHLAAAASIGLTGINLLSLGIAAARLRARYRIAPPAADADPVTIVRPLCGAEPFIEETLRSSFTLDYPSFELLFCVEDADDPAMPVVRRLMAAYPDVRARLLIGEDRISDNPKLNNCIKGWREARHDWIILADSNVLMPRDYVQHLRAAWRRDTGLVCATPIGSAPGGFWAEVECAFLNTLQARWQYVGEALGLGFAQGKSMLWRRDFLDARGGLHALACEIAEDAAATKSVRQAGLHVHLVPAPFEQPLGARTLGDVWKRQARWARLRRVTFPLFFAPEILSGIGVALMLAIYAAATSDESAILTALLLFILWYGAEAVLAARKGWHLSWRYPIACLVRDAVMVPLWINGWIGNDVTWRGNVLRLCPKAEPYPHNDPELIETR